MAKLLLVEDDKDLSEMICDWLHAEHYSIETAFGGRIGCDLLLGSEYDLAIIDWNLPGMDGLEICQRYRMQ